MIETTHTTTLGPGAYPGPFRYLGKGGAVVELELVGRPGIGMPWRYRFSTSSLWLDGFRTKHDALRDAAQKCGRTGMTMGWEADHG